MSSPHQAASSSHRSLFKEILQGSGIYLLGSIAQRLVSVLMVPVTTRFLTTAEFGIADLLSQCTDILSMLLGARFGSALGYFYFEEDSPEHRRSVVTTSILGALLLGAFATLICRPFSVPMARFVFGDASNARYLNLLLLLLPATFTCEATFSLLRVENRPIAFTGMSFLSLLLQASGIIALVAFLRWHVMGIVATSCVNATLMALLLGGLALRRFKSRFDLSIFKRMMRYSVPLGLAGIATFFIHVGDRFILPHYRSLSDLGIYVLAYKFGFLLSFFYGSFHTYWSAQVFGVMRRKDADAVFARIFTYVLLGTTFAAVALVVCSRPALRILVDPKFLPAEPLVPVIVSAYFLRAVGDFLRCTFLVENRPGYDAICNWIGAAACAAGYWLLIPRFGMWGAAYATLAAFAAISAISAVWTYRLRPYRIEPRLMKVAAAAAAAILPYCVLRVSSLEASIASACLSLAAFAAALWILRFPTPGELDTARLGLARLQQRFLAKT